MKRIRSISAARKEVYSFIVFVLTENAEAMLG